MTSFKVKLVISVLAIVILNIWNRYGNFKIIIREYGILILNLSVVAAIVLIYSLSIYKSRKPNSWFLIVPTLFGIHLINYFLEFIPIHSLPQLSILIPGILLAVMIIFRNNLFRQTHKL